MEEEAEGVVTRMSKSGLLEVKVVAGLSEASGRANLGFDSEAKKAGRKDTECATKTGSSRARRACGSVEFVARRGLVGTYLAGGDLGLVEVFPFDGVAGEAAEHGYLADMRERVGDGALEKLGGSFVQRVR